MSSSTTQTTLNRQPLYRLTKGILNANSLHFILISLLFLPFNFSAFTAVQFYFFYSPTTDVTTELDPFNLLLIKTIVTSSQNLLTVKTVITVIAFCCFAILPTVAGIALITYSTNQAIHNKTITFSSSIKSLSRSFTTLLYTLIARTIKLTILFLALTLFSIIVTEAIKALGLDSGLFFFSACINSTISYVLAITVLFYIIIWGSAAVITALELKSGSETLRQSANQSTKFRIHSFSIVFIAGAGIGTAMAYSSILQNTVPTANWMLIVQVGAMCLQSSLMIVLYVAANTVLYVQCKVGSGEDSGKTLVEGKLSDKYVRLVVDNNDGEVVHELPKEANGGFRYKYNLYLLAIVLGNFIMCVILSDFYVV